MQKEWKTGEEDNYYGSDLRGLRSQGRPWIDSVKRALDARGM